MGVFGANALEGCFKAAVIVDVEVTLVVGGLILRAVVHYRGVGIPFYVVDFRVAGHKCVYDVEHYVLHFGVGQVEYQLSASAAFDSLALRCLDYVLGVLLVEFRHAVGHLGFNPDAELDAAFAGGIAQALDAVRQLAGVDIPVAQRSRVVVAWIFHAEPSVVHHKQFTAHGGNVAHHLQHALLVDVEVHAFPAVEQNLACFGAVGQTVVAAPAVEVAADTAQTLTGVGQCQRRSDELFALGQIIGRVFLVYAGEEVVIVRVVGVEHEFIVAAVAQRGTNGASAVLHGRAVERNHHFTMGCMRVSHAVLIFYHFQTVRQRCLLHAAFVGP